MRHRKHSTAILCLLLAVLTTLVVVVYSLMAFESANAVGSGAEVGVDTPAVAAPETRSSEETLSVTTPHVDSAIPNDGVPDATGHSVLADDRHDDGVSSLPAGWIEPRLPYGSLRVIVVDTHGLGQPLAGVAVSVVEFDHCEPAWDPPTMYTDSRGEVVFERCVAGPVKVCSRLFQSLDAVVVADEQATVTCIARASILVRGVVLGSDGIVASGAEIMDLSTVIGAAELTGAIAKSNNDGEFELRAALGHLGLYAAREGHQSSLPTFLRLYPGQSDITGVELRLRPGGGQIDVICRLPTGEPVPDVVVTATLILDDNADGAWAGKSGEGSVSIAVRRPQWVGVSDSDGRAALTGVSAGTYRVQATHSQLLQAALRENSRVSVLPGTSTVTTVVLDVGLTIEGRVTDYYGNPCAAAIVRSWVEAAESWLPKVEEARDVVRYSASCGEGYFRIRALPAGPIHLAVRWNGQSLYREVVTTGGTNPMWLQIADFQPQR